MKWLRSMVRAFLGQSRYHDQANEVNNRRLRTELLMKRLQVIERSHDQ